MSKKEEIESEILEIQKKEAERNFMWTFIEAAMDAWEQKELNGRIGGVTKKAEVEQLAKDKFPEALASDIDVIIEAIMFRKKDKYDSIVMTQSERWEKKEKGKRDLERAKDSAKHVKVK